MGLAETKKSELPAEKNKPENLSFSAQLASKKKQSLNEPPELDESIRQAAIKIRTLKEKGSDGIDKAFKTNTPLELPQLAAFSLEETKAKMKEELEKSMQKFRDTLAEEIDPQKSKFPGERKKFAAEIELKAAKEVDKIVLAVESLINASLQRGEKDFTPESVAKLEQLSKNLKNIESMALQDPKTTRIMEKLNNEESLSPEEYEKIAGMLKPNEAANLTPKNAAEKSKEANFEASAGGIMIALMRPDQRYKLFNEFILGKKSDQEALKIIDSFAPTGLITIIQAESLFKSARTRNIITSDAELQTYLEKCRGNGQTKGEYQLKKEELTKQLGVVAEHLKGMAATNQFDKFIGPPMVGTLMLFHSIIWMFTNLLAVKGNFKNLFLSVPFIAATGELILSREIASGSVNTPNGLGVLGTIGKGSISKFIKGLAVSDRPKEKKQQEAFYKLHTIYSNDPNFGEYLKQGGAKTIIDISLNKEREKQPKTITYQEISKKELVTNSPGKTSNEPSTLLNNSIKSSSNEKVMKQVNEVSEVIKDLDIGTQFTFNQYLQKIREAQGIPKENF